ncbi:MAG TPA: hypothetical protein VL172_00695 [Kofleriaceae bacterium]|nr:hypothetical protein [Kofleriaceae bacterium]
MNRPAVALAAALLLYQARIAAADGKAELDAAAQAIDGVDFESARTHAQAARAGGDLPRGQLIRAYRLLGEIAGALDDAEAARASFTRWLLLDPAGALPDGMSPKITGPFAEARAEVKRLGPLALELSVRRRPGVVAVTVQRRDPLHMIARLQSAPQATVDGDHLEIPAEDARPVAIEIAAVDEQGNVLVTERVTAEARATEPHHRGKRLPAALRWPTWTAVALVAAGSGGFFAWRVGQAQDDLDALNADSMQHTFDEARAIQDRGERAALGANISLAVAGAAAAAAVLTLVLER